MHKIKKQDKKAWIRILEAFIAIAIIFSVTILVYSKTAKKVDREEEIMRIERIILESVSHNELIRGAVLKTPPGIEQVRAFISTKMPVSLDFDITICNLDEICNIYKPYDVYVDEVVISSTLQEYKPKKLRLFVWQR